MKASFPIPQTNMPEEGLRLFHSISNWVEKNKTRKIHLISWKDGQKHLSLLRCIKLTDSGQPNIPVDLPDNTLYIPKYSYGLYVIRHIRNAFCHNGLTYDDRTKDYHINIKLTNEKMIAGRFTLDAIIEFIAVYVQPAKQKDRILKSK